MAGVLLHPSIMNVESLSLFGFSIKAMDYSSNVIPVFLVVALMYFVEPLVEKISPKQLIFFLKPLFTIIIVAPLMLLVLAPLGGYIGEYLAQTIEFLSSKANWLMVSLVGAIAPLMIMTGMHYAYTPVTMAQFAAYGYDTLMFPAMLAANLAQSGAGFAVAMKTKGKDKTIASSTDFTAALGITEPVMYGVNLPRKKPFVAAMIGGACGGMFAGIMGLKCFAFASAGLASLPIFLGTNGYRNITIAVITMMISFVSSFIAAYIIVPAEK